jgi:hypothetical protein
MFAFWRPTHQAPEDRGRVFVATVEADRFTTVLEKAANLLEQLAAL